MAGAMGEERIGSRGKRNCPGRSICRHRPSPPCARGSAQATLPERRAAMVVECPGSTKGELTEGGFMLGNLLTRRAALVGFGAFAAAALSGCNTTPSAGVQPMAALASAAISVDTSPLVAYVGNPTAGWVQQSLPGQLAQVLGSRASGGLHVRIDTLYLGNGGPARSGPDERRRDCWAAGRSMCGRSRPIFPPRPTRRCRNRRCRAGCRRCRPPSLTG